MSSYYSYPPSVYFLFVFPSLNHLCYLYSSCLFFSASLRISDLIVVVAVVLVIVPPLAHFLFFCAPPPSARARALEKDCFNAWTKTFIRSIFLLCLHYLDFFLFSVCVFLIYVFVLGRALRILFFFSILFVTLELSFLHCSRLMLLLLLHVLAPCFCAWGRVLPFYGDCLGGLLGDGHEGGVNIFFGFSHNRDVWVKTGAALEGEGSYGGLVASCYCIIGVKKRPFSICRRKRYNNTGFRGKHVPMISDPPLF